MRIFFFLVLTILGITACQTKNSKATEKRSLSCYIRVLESEGRVRAEATMSTKVHPDSTSQPIEVPNGILYQGTMMNLIPNQGLTYFKDFPGTYMEDHKFTWEGTDRTPMALSLKMNSIKKFSFGQKAISASKPATLTWENNGLEKGESLVLIWENAKENRTVPMELYIQGTFPKIEFPAGKMKELTPGVWTLYVVRKKLTRSEVGNVSTQTIMEFYSQTDTLNVVQ